MLQRHLFALSIVVMVLLTACGGGNDAATPAAQSSPDGQVVVTATTGAGSASTPAASTTEVTAGVGVQSTATSGPALPPATEAAAATTPAPADATAGMPEATAPITEPTAGAEPTQQSSPTKTAKSVDANSPLAIPARMLRGYGLTLNTGVGEQQNQELKKFNGQVTLTNLWSGDLQQPKGLVLAWDFRFTFDTERNAHRAYADLRKSVNQDELSPGVRLKAIPGEQDYGDEGAAFEAKNAQTGGTFYLVAFRTENIVAYVILGADKSFTRKKALPLFRAADRQVDRAVR